MPAPAKASECLSLDTLRRLKERDGVSQELRRWAAHLACCEYCGNATKSLNLDQAVLKTAHQILQPDDQLLAALCARLQHSGSDFEPAGQSSSDRFATLDRMIPPQRTIPNQTTSPGLEQVFEDRDPFEEPAKPMPLPGKKTALPPIPDRTSRPPRPDPKDFPYDTPASAKLLQLLSPPQSEGEVGRLGSYRILKVIGSGAVGVVFKAEDIHLKRMVALKLLRPEDLKDEVARERFMREGRAIAALDHPNVVSVYQVGEERGLPYMAMQLLTGETLDVKLHREKRVHLMETLRIAKEIAAGLAAAHDRGLVHRDVKPANIWLEAETGRIKILDFGLARATSDEIQLTKTGTVVGTPAFMSPEQAKGGGVDHRTDLYSLGCVIYMMCAGVPPITAEDTMSMLLALATDQPRPLQSLNPDVPPPLAGLVNKLLIKHPQARPGSAYDVITTLEAIEKVLPSLMPGEVRQQWAELEGKPEAQRTSRLVPVLLWSLILMALGFTGLSLFAPDAWMKQVTDSLKQWTKPR